MEVKGQINILQRIITILYSVSFTDIVYSVSYTDTLLGFRFLWGDFSDDWSTREGPLVRGWPHLWGHSTFQETAGLENFPGGAGTLHWGPCVDRPDGTVQQNQNLGTNPEPYLQVSY